MFVCLNSGLECSSNLKEVINLRARFCSIRRGLRSFCRDKTPPKTKAFYHKMQGPRRNFEIGRGGGGASLVTQYRGGTSHFFLLILYNFKNIWGGGACAQPPPPPPHPYSAVPEMVRS